MIGFFVGGDDSDNLKEAVRAAIASGQTSGVVLFQTTGEAKPKVIEVPGPDTRQ